MARRRFGLLPIANLPKWQRYTFSPRFGCWLAPPKPWNAALTTLVRQRADEAGHDDTEVAYATKTRHRKEIYKIVHELKRGKEHDKTESKVDQVKKTISEYARSKLLPPADDKGER